MSAEFVTWSCGAIRRELIEFVREHNGRFVVDFDGARGVSMDIADGKSILEQIRQPANKAAAVAEELEQVAAELRPKQGVQHAAELKSAVERIEAKWKDRIPPVAQLFWRMIGKGEGLETVEQNLEWLWFVANHPGNRRAFTSIPAAVVYRVEHGRWPVDWEIVEDAGLLQAGVVAKRVTPASQAPAKQDAAPIELTLEECSKPDGQPSKIAVMVAGPLDGKGGEQTFAVVVPNSPDGKSVVVPLRHLAGLIECLECIRREVRDTTSEPPKN